MYLKILVTIAEGHILIFFFWYEPTQYLFFVCLVNDRKSFLADLNYVIILFLWYFLLVMYLLNK